LISQIPGGLIHSPVKIRKIVWLSKILLPFENSTLLLGEDTAKGNMLKFPADL